MPLVVTCGAISAVVWCGGGGDSAASWTSVAWWAAAPPRSSEHASLGGVQDRIATVGAEISAVGGHLLVISAVVVVRANSAVSGNFGGLVGRGGPPRSI